jgi:hypothetical protein
VVSFTPRPLYPQGKSPCYPLDRRLGVPQSRSGRSGEEKNSQPLPEFEPPIIQPVAQPYTTELSRLLAIEYANVLYEGVISLHLHRTTLNAGDQGILMILGCPSLRQFASSKVTELPLRIRPMSNSMIHPSPRQA